MPSLPRRPKLSTARVASCSCVRRRTHLSWSSVMAALARFGFGSRQPILVSGACTPVAHRFWVCIAVSLSCDTPIPKNIGGPPSLLHVQSKVPVGVEGSSSFHLLVDRHSLKVAEERVDQELVLVGLNPRSMTQSRMPRVCVRRTVAAAPRHQELLYPQKTPSRGHKL